MSSNSEHEVDEWANLPVSEKIILSHGPIIVYSTQRGAEMQAELGNRFEILHGWSPLLLSTAKCFTRLMYYGEEPTCAPVIWKLVVHGVETKVYTKCRPEVEKEDENLCIVEEIETAFPPAESTAVANIFMADMTNFSETVEMHVTANTSIYSERIDRVVLKSGGKLILNHF